MGNLHLVTGYLGYDHISAEDQGAFNAALIGNGQFVLKKGYVFRADIIDSVTIRVHDGELMMCGRFVRMEPNTWVDLAIDSGTVGMKRNDLIAVRYTKDANTGVESVNLVVIKGTAVASNPVDPACTDTKGEDDNLENGRATLHEYPLWRIPIDGTTVGTPVCLFGEPYEDSMQTLPSVRKEMAQLKREIFATAAGVETGDYYGNGSTTKIISTSIKPMLMVISKDVGGNALGLDTQARMQTIIRGVSEYIVSNNNSRQVSMMVEMGDTSVKLTGSGATTFNEDGKHYYYVIVGN